MLSMSRFKEEFDEIKEIGQGGFGQVYKARNIIDHQKYAIKSIVLTGDKINEVNIVKREAQSLARLKHPNVVHYNSAWIEYYSNGNSVSTEDDIPEECSNPTSNEFPIISQAAGDVLSSSRAVSINKFLDEESGNQPFVGTGSSGSSQISCDGIFLYIQMQLCDSSLDTWLEDRNTRISTNILSPSDVNSSLDIYKQLLNALAYIHSENILHRDVKPENILVNGEKPHVLLGDFGLSRPISSKNYFIETPIEDVKSKSPVIDAEKYTPEIGTSLYAAPEQLHTSNYDFKADMYSAGMILYELTSTFRTVSEKQEYFKRLKLQDPELPEGYTERFSNIASEILSLVSSNPENRPSAEESLKIPLFLQPTDLQIQKTNEIEELQNENAALRKCNEAYRKLLIECGKSPDDLVQISK